MGLKRRRRAFILVALGVAVLMVALPPRPSRPLRVRAPFVVDLKTGQIIIQSPISLWPEALAANQSQSYAAHGWAQNVSVTGTSLAASHNGSSALLTLPSPADQALWCLTTYEVSMINNSGSTATPDFIPGGISNPQLGNGLPYYPYVGIAHPPGGGTGYPCSIGGCGNPGIYFSIPASGSAATDAWRVDSIMNGGTPTATAISSCSFATPAVTCTATGFASNAGFSTCSGAGCAGAYVQVFGSSIAGDNSQPGPGSGGTFPLTTIAANSFTYTDVNGAVCSSGCGTAYTPYNPGGPPYTVLAGSAGGLPALTAYVEQPASGTNTLASYAVVGQYMCVPLQACATQTTVNSGCGIGTSLQ